MKLLLIIVVVVIICMGVIYGIGSYLVQARPSIVGAVPNDLKNTIAVSFPSQSGSQLSGWFMQSNQKKGAVLLLHGVKSNRLQMLDRARFLQKEGYSVLLFDFQAEGESQGKHITFGYLESLDAQSAYEYLEQRVMGENIAVIGISLGGASALLGTVSKKAKVMILESVYPTIDEAIKNRLEIYIGSFAKIFSPLLTLQLQPRLGISKDDLRPIDKIENVSGAIMIIAGSLDQHTTLSESQYLFSRAKEPKELWVIDGLGHVNFAKALPEEYQERVLSFLAKWM